MLHTGLDYLALEGWLDSLIKSINLMFANLLAVLGNTSWFDTILANGSVETIITAIKGVAITLCLMFFLMDFFSKTLDLQWVKWENVMMLFIKLILAKVVIDKSPEICQMICNGFSSIVTTALGGADQSFTFIDLSNKEVAYQQFGLTLNEAEKVVNKPTITFLDFSPMMIQIKGMIMSMIIMIILIICYAIVLGRVFELAVYTIIAPIPLSTFSCDGLRDVGKGFLKSYVAVSLQALVLALMFVAYTTIVRDITITAPGFSCVVNVLTLSLGVMQSGAWAKRICNAM